MRDVQTISASRSTSHGRFAIKDNVPYAIDFRKIRPRDEDLIRSAVLPSRGRMPHNLCILSAWPNARAPLYRWDALLHPEPHALWQRCFGGRAMRHDNRARPVRGLSRSRQRVAELVTEPLPPSRKSSNIFRQSQENRTPKKGRPHD